MRKLGLPLVCVAALAVVLAACTAGSTGYALIVEGHTISNQSFRRELRALRDNKPFARSLGQNGVDVATTSGTISAQIAAAWLGQLAEQEVIDRDLARRGITVGAADRRAAESQAAQLFGTPDVFAAFPGWFRDRVLERQARQIALLRRLVPVPTDAQARAFFDQNRRQLCPSGKLVSHILVATRAEADAIEAQLEHGADFAVLARAQSTDSGSAQQGGALGCLGSQQFVPEFESAAVALAVGQVSPPVQTQFGFHVIKVAAYTFDAARSDVERALAQQAQQGIQQQIERQLARAHVKIDPVYGTWGTTARGLGVVPPAEPKVRDEPAPSTSAPLGAPPAAPGPGPRRP